MWYEINVSQNKQHYFATSKRSLGTKAKAIALYNQFKVLFPEELGYKLEITRWEQRGSKINPEEEE